VCPQIAEEIQTYWNKKPRLTVEETDSFGQVGSTNAPVLDSFFVNFIMSEFCHHHLSRIRPLGLFQFRILFLKLMNLSGQLLGLLGQAISLMQGLYLHTGQHNTEKCRHTSMP
jgi:hypothetical protein